jgi:hypothetical protein
MSFCIWFELAALCFGSEYEDFWTDRSGNLFGYESDEYSNTYTETNTSQREILDDDGSDEISGSSSNISDNINNNSPKAPSSYSSDCEFKNDFGKAGEGAVQRRSIHKPTQDLCENTSMINNVNHYNTCIDTANNNKKKNNDCIERKTNDSNLDANAIDDDDDYSDYIVVVPQE